MLPKSASLLLSLILLIVGCVNEPTREVPNESPDGLTRYWISSASGKSYIHFQKASDPHDVRVLKMVLCKPYFASWDRYGRLWVAHNPGAGYRDIMLFKLAGEQLTCKLKMLKGDWDECPDNFQHRRPKPVAN
jgi:hypothetical protein